MRHDPPEPNDRPDDGPQPEPERDPTDWERIDWPKEGDELKRTRGALADSQRWRRRLAETHADVLEQLDSSEAKLERVLELHAPDDDGNCIGCASVYAAEDCPTRIAIETEPVELDPDVDDLSQIVWDDEEDEEDD